MQLRHLAILILPLVVIIVTALFLLSNFQDDTTLYFQMNWRSFIGLMLGILFVLIAIDRLLLLWMIRAYQNSIMSKELHARSDLIRNIKHEYFENMPQDIENCLHEMDKTCSIPDCQAIRKIITATIDSFKAGGDGMHDLERFWTHTGILSYLRVTWRIFSINFTSYSHAGNEF